MIDRTDEQKFKKLIQKRLSDWADWELQLEEVDVILRAVRWAERQMDGLK